MGTRRILDIHNDATNGQISKEIAAWHRQGHAPTEIAFRLREKGIRVDPNTVRRYVADMVATW